MTHMRQAVRREPPPLIQTMLLQFFDGDLARAALWFRTQNPELGGVTPIDMARAGRRSQLRRFVAEALAENFALIAAGGWLTAEQLRQACEFTVADELTRWQKEGKLFAISHLGQKFYPRYLLDESFRPLPGVVLVLKELGAISSWSVAIWFESANAWLSGARLRERLAGDSEAVLYAAKQYRNLSQG